MDKILPQNIEAEEAILGGIMLDPEAISRIAEILKPEHFALIAHQKIYKFALSLFFQGKPTYPMSLSTHLADLGHLESVGGQIKLAQLVDRTVSAVNIDQYALLVIEKAMRRDLIRATAQISEMAYNTTMSIEEVLEKTEEMIFAITQFNIKNRDLVHVSETLVSSFEDIEAKHEGTAQPGLTCNFYDLDAMTGGFQRSDFIIVAARPAMGKTSFKLAIASQVAKIHKMPVAIFSMEMSREQLVNRLLSVDAKIESTRLRSGTIAQNEWEPLSESIGKISELPLYIDDTPNISVVEMRSKVRRLQAEQGSIAMVLIDYLQLMGGDGENRVQELSKITRSLKIMAREINAPVIALSQLNRGVESRADKRPMMSDLRESGSIEQDADLVIMLHRDDYYNPNSPDRGMAEVIITKHRNGPTGTIKLLFEPKFTEFRNLAGGDRYLPAVSF